ncbi:outer membrane beta-barrel protein [Flavobacterium luminosum]|uniref:Porin family protein n=1 Tax=Flavobacterium luminosum TaxID=2949086 RepID=A0ABT0TL08_9FLAO|nr:outer membrane beta-barrel protein [Flavobacterium sp. HXWNR70]MCL9808172.1 porin family protein [Flavobacterium sp. HXWNR70]
MIKKLLLAACMVSTLTMTAQTEEPTSNTDKKGWYLKAGGSYFIQTAATEFPIVSGRQPNSDVYVAQELVSRKAITGSFGEGFRTGLTAGYRFTERLGFEMGINYYRSNSKTMAQTKTDQIFVNDNNEMIFNFTANGKVTAFDLAPALVLYLGETNGFEPYTKVGVLVPVHGDLEITTNAVIPTSPTTVGNLHKVDKVKPNPTIGFMAALGTSYKLTNKLSAFAEVEYRNFTVHGKSKETTEYTVNGVDRLNTLAPAQIHSNYVDSLGTNSNNAETNPNGVDPTKPLDELSSYISISGVGLTLGLKYSL